MQNKSDFKWFITGLTLMAGTSVWTDEGESQTVVGDDSFKDSDSLLYDKSTYIEDTDKILKISNR